MFWNDESGVGLSDSMLQRPRSSNSYIVASLMNNLFNKVTDKTAKKKNRAKTIHIYRDNNSQCDGDLMNLLSNSKKSDMKDSSKKDVLMLREKSLNSEQRSKNKIQVTNDSIKDPTTVMFSLPSRDPLDLLGAHSLLRKLFDETVEKVKSGAQLSTNKGNKLEYPNKIIINPSLNAEFPNNCLQLTIEPVTKAICDVAVTHEPISDIFLENNSANFEINEEAIDDSEEEHEILSMLSELRNPGRSSTISLVEAITTDTSAEWVDSKHNNGPSQLSQVNNYGNFQEEDLNFACDLNDIDIHDSNLPIINMADEHSDSMNNNNMKLDTRIKSQHSTPITSQIISEIGEEEVAFLTTQDSTNHQPLSSYQKKINLESLAPEREVNSNFSESAQFDKPMVKVSKGPLNSVLVDNLNLCNKGKQMGKNLIPRAHKRKSTLAEICGKTNRAKAPLRVGLSKRVKIDSLHNYLDS